MKKHGFMEGGIAPYVALLLTPCATRGRFRHHTSTAFIIIASMVLLASCGFQPMHGQAYRANLGVDLSAIAVEVSGSSLNVLTTNKIPRRYTELLKAEIEDNANPKHSNSAKQFLITITFTESELGIFVNPDGTASRGDLNYDSSYTIRRLADATSVASGTIRRISSFNSSPTADYASYVSIEDARKRGMMELAQDYTLRLASLLPTLNNADATAFEVKPQAPALDLQPMRNHEALRPRN